MAEPREARERSLACREGGQEAGGLGPPASSGAPEGRPMATSKPCASRGASVPKPSLAPRGGEVYRSYDAILEPRGHLGRARGDPVVLSSPFSTCLSMLTS